MIEGYDGRSVEVDLQPGEMLFYESAKCIRERPRPLEGKWYTLFSSIIDRSTGALRMEDARALAEKWWGSEGSTSRTTAPSIGCSSRGRGTTSSTASTGGATCPASTVRLRRRRAAARGELWGRGGVTCIV